MNTLPVPVLFPVLTDSIEVDTEDGESLLNKIQSLESEKSKLEAEQKQIEEFVSKQIDKIHRKIPAQIQAIEALTIEVQTLEVELYLLNEENENIINDLRQKDGEPNFGETKIKEKESEGQQNTKSIKDKCAKLYKKIANYTHPDKATNKRLIPYFSLANKLYKELDLESLRLLLTDVLSVVNAKSIRAKSEYLNILRSRYSSLLKIVEDLRLSVKNRVGCNDFIIATLFETPGGEDRALLCYLQHVKAKYDSLMRRKKALKRNIDVIKNPNKYKVQSSVIPSWFYADSETVNKGNDWK